MDISAFNFFLAILLFLFGSGILGFGLKQDWEKIQDCKITDDFSKNSVRWGDIAANRPFIKRINGQTKWGSFLFIAGLVLYFSANPLA